MLCPTPDPAALHYGLPTRAKLALSVDGQLLGKMSEFELEFQHPPVVKKAVAKSSFDRIADGSGPEAPKDLAEARFAVKIDASVYFQPNGRDLLRGSNLRCRLRFAHLLDASGERRAGQTLQFWNDYDVVGRGEKVYRESLKQDLRRSAAVSVLGARAEPDFEFLDSGRYGKELQQYARNRNKESADRVFTNLHKYGVVESKVSDVVGKEVLWKSGDSAPDQSQLAAEPDYKVSCYFEFSEREARAILHYNATVFAGDALRNEV